MRTEAKGRRWLRLREIRAEAGRRGAAERMRRRAEAMAGEPVRCDLPAVPLRLTIEQIGQPRRVLELRRRTPTGKRTWMFENGRLCGPRGKCLLFRLAERTTYV